MSTVDLIRVGSSTHGTRGVLLFDGEPLVVTIEPPWRDNLPNISCIPAGEYECLWHHSPTFGWCYEVQDVPGRSAILIHAGNVGGDRNLGLKTNTYGCILPGTRFGTLWGQRAVLASRTALTKLHNRLQQQPFTLRIHA